MKTLLPHSDCGPEPLASGATEQDCTISFVVQSLSDTERMCTDVMFPYIYP